MNWKFFLIVLLAQSCLSRNQTQDGKSADTQVELSWENNMKFLENEAKNISFTLSHAYYEDFDVFMNTTHQHTSVEGKSPLKYPSEFVFLKNTSSTSVRISGNVVGQMVIIVNTSINNISLADNSRLRLYVIHSHTIEIVNQVIGWIYFVAWSISFYPQVILNFQRKSVVGLNFDFLALNITGFIAYCLYNIGMFWIPLVKEQYLVSYPDGVNPVQVNDVFFTIHACAITIVTIIQCFIYERGGQRVSKVAMGLIGIATLAMFALLFVAVAGKITWLIYLTIFSYVKLGVTLIKYVPQAYMNFRRKSTVGWSIGNVLLDFTGGSLSILQMIMQSYNNSEWDLVFGDPTKFGLGLFSVLFDVLFMVQHYILYRHPKSSSYQVLNEDTED